MAQTKRAAKRKAGRGVDDTDIVEDVEGIEEDLEQEEEDGIKLEAFNLKASVQGPFPVERGREALAVVHGCMGRCRRLGLHRGPGALCTPRAGCALWLA